MSTTTTTRTPSRKPSFLRHKIRDSFRPSTLRGLLEHSEKDASKQTSADIKRTSIEEGSWIARKRRKNKQVQDEPGHVIGELKIDVGDFEDLKASLDSGAEMYSLRSPQTVTTLATIATAETYATTKPVEKPLMQNSNHRSPAPGQTVGSPQPMELEDTSSNLNRPGDAMDIDSPPPESKVEIRKGPKWQIKTDALVRPVSSGRANPLSANVSHTIAAINKNNFQANAKWSSTVDNMASARPSIESSRSKLTSTTNGTDKVDSVMGSNVSISTASATTRRPLGDTSRANHAAGNRHISVDPDKSTNSHNGTQDQENKRSSYPPVAARRQSLVNMHSTQHRPKSPNGSIASTTSAQPRPRRPSGTNVSSRLSWIQNLENNGQNPGQEYMLKKLEGGVADKLRRFESQKSDATGSSSRSQSATRASDTYGIEAKRLSRTTTADSDFRKKLEEQFQKKRQEDEEREKKRTSVSTSKTPQQIIDFAELNDRDRESSINDLMRDGKGADNAKALDAQARTVLKTQPRSSAQQVGAILQNTSSALKPTTSLLEQAATNSRRFEVRGGPQKAIGLMQSVQKPQATGSLQRTMSVQQRPKQTATTRPARPASYAAAPAPVDDDYDPFNYASYPSRSAIYSNPPEAPAMTPEYEVAEDVAMTAVEVQPVVAGETDAAQPKPALEVAHESPAEEGLVEPAPKAFAPKDEVKDQKASHQSPQTGEIPATSEATTKVAEVSIVPKPVPAASSWGSRFQARDSSPKVEAPKENAGVEAAPTAPAKVSSTKSATAEIVAKDEPQSVPTSSRIPLRGGAQKPAAVIAGASPEEHEASEALVAREAVPASPTLVEVVKSKKATADAGASPTTPTAPTSDAKLLPVKCEGKVNDSPVVPSADSSAVNAAPSKSSIPIRTASGSGPARASSLTKQAPASAQLANEDVKIASPSSSSGPPKEFNAAALPQMGTA